jgi:Flp pilus assembly pilin Flp
MLTKLYVKLQAPRGDEGASALEYAVLVAVIASVLLGILQIFFGGLGTVFNAILQKIQTSLA